MRSPIALPAGEIGKLNRKGRERRSLSNDKRPVKRREFLDEYTHRPAVPDHLVQGEEQQVLRLGKAHEARSQQRAPGKVERMEHFVLDELLSDTLLFGGRQGLQVVKWQGYSRVLRNHLHVSVFGGHKGCAQDVVTLHDLVDAPFKNIPVDRRRQQERVNDVEERQA